MAQEARLVIVIDSERAKRTAQDLSVELDSITKKGDFASKSMDRMSVATRALAGYMAGLLTVGSAISKMDTYTGLQNRLKLVTNNQVELNKATEDTFRIAQKTYSAWDSVLQVYQRFSDNAKTLNLTMDDTARLTETVSKAVAISGASAEAADAALVQFGQALASGTLRGEELNSVMEQTPALAKAIAKGMGITVGELRSVAAEGKITSQEIVKALKNVQDEVDALFAKTDITIGQSLTLLNNEITKFVGEAGKGSGAAQALSGSIQLLANNLNLIADSAFAIGIGLMTKAVLTKTVAVQASIAASTKQVFATIAERNANIAAAKAEVESALAEAQSTQVTLTNIKATHAQIMAEIELEKVRLKAQITEQGRTATITRMAQLGRLQAQVALEVAAAETAQSAASSRLSAALTAQSVATSRLALAKSALMAIFSPMGLAIAATAASFYLLSSSSDEVKESLATQSDSVSDLTDKYIKLNTVQALTEGVRLRKEIEQQNDAIDDASGAIKRFAYIQKELFKLSGSDYEDYQNAIKSIATGASDAGDLLKKMISSGRFSQNQIDKLIEFSSAVAESKNKIEQGNTALKLLNATSRQHVEVTAESIKQLTIQTNLTKVATQNFTDMKTQMLDSLRAQVEFIRLNGGSEEQVKSLNKVIQAYSLNQISATDAVSKFNSTAKIPAENIKGLQDHATKTDQSKIALNQANAELKKQNDLRNEYLKQHQTVLAAQQGETNELNNQVAAQEKLNKLRDNANKDILKNDFLIKNTKAFGGGEKGLDKARAASEFYTDNKIPMTRSLTSQEAAIFEAWYKKQKEAKDLQESITESSRKQTKESEKKLKITQAELEVAKRSAALIESSGLGKYAESKGIPSSVIAGLLAQESQGIREAKSHTGAIGYFQTTSGYRKQNNMSVADSYDLEKSGKIVIDNIAKVYEKTGDLAQAILSHNAGEGGARQFTKTGKVKGSAERNKEVSQYVAKVSRYSDIIAGGVGKGGLSDGDSDRAYGKQIKARLELVKQGLNLQEQYEEEQAKRTKARNEEINLAQQTGQTALIPKIKERYKAQDELAKLQQDFEVNGYKWTEKQKLEYTYETNSLRLVAEGKLSEDQRKVALGGLELQKQQELGLLKLAQEQRLFQAEQFMLGEMERIKKRYALEYDEISKITDLEERRRKMSAFQADFIRNGVGNPTIDQYDTSSQFLKSTNYTKPKQTNMQVLDEDYAQTYQKLKDNLAAVLESEKASYQERLEAERVFKEARQQMDNEYHLKAIDARKADHDSQLQLYSQMISSASSTWGGLTQIVKDARGENSRSFKAMFIAQQSFAIASAIISAHLAATQVAADATIPFFGAKIAASTAMLAMGYANAGLIAGQTIAGFSDGGFTGSGGKYQPAGIVHKGEIVWSQEDIKRWGGVGLVEKMRKSANPEAFLNNNASADSVMRRAMMSSSAFIESQKQADIFNQPVQDTQIIYKGNGSVPTAASSASSDLFHDGKVYFSSNGLVQDRSNLDDVQDFTLGRTSRPKAEIMPSIERASPTVNFKIEVINQVSGATVEAEQLDEQTVRIIVKDELDKQLPRTVPKLVSDQIGNPNSTISRSLTENTTARRNR
ncbi:tape measure protein [Acinetobacter baumannii]|uniref:tape measure protein n=2 Tax=Acinetobacter baumannii TaxID=470 RepID=UPI00021B73FA|nr:tape measure protein [Acinetobacter baumannii]KCW27694.1 tape measure domain protein [Acinetobacter baumannii 6935]EGT94568.1 tail tape measure protein [Acinetobacter baumannii ABNIH2]EHT4720708.1 tape measure protein [Acinetobacter baumannii]EHZ7543676.1 tape measure protein [Acinetobacter baumannii]EHZ7600981.1 tape measure protein [Acinetobacter baumannii]